MRPVSRIIASTPAASAVASRWASIRARQPEAAGGGHDVHPLDLGRVRGPGELDVAAASPRAGDDGYAVEETDEERAPRRDELGGVDRRLVATAVAHDVLLLHLLDQRLGVRIVDRDLSQVQFGSGLW